MDPDSFSRPRGERIEGRQEPRPGEEEGEQQDDAASEPNRPGRDEKLRDAGPDARTRFVRNVSQGVPLRAERDEREDDREERAEHHTADR